jgi:hypothetical protein
LEWIGGYKLTNVAAAQAAGLDSDAIIPVCVASGLRRQSMGCSVQTPIPATCVCDARRTRNQYALGRGPLTFGMMDQLEEWMKEKLIRGASHNQSRLRRTGNDFVALSF